MKCFSEAICRCTAAADVAFTDVMVAEGIKVFLTICALIYAADPLTSCLSNEVTLQQLVYLPCVSLEVGAS